MSAAKLHINILSRFEQALRVDRPPAALSFATPSFMPATQGQRYAAEFTAISSVFEIIACGTVSIQLILET